jgi:phosphoadenosine phosphosulfate reductase
MIDPADPTLAARVNAAGVLLGRVAPAYAPAVFASSFGAEDMVVLDLIARARLPIRVFTLDTGRLPQETHDLIHRARRHYGIAIDVYTPQADAVQSFVHDHGTNAFYDSVALRQQCCGIRKSEPLRRALSGAGAWITGMRRAQGVTRQAIAIEEHDATHGLPKFNPLADWSEDEVWAHLRERRVPWNALHDRGYPSIGCAPCTRPIQPGEDIRAGRWWWERPDQKECGLHRRPQVAVSLAVQ